MATTYSWDMNTRAIVLSSFFWGYICSQILGALLAQRYGGVVVLGCATFFWSLLTCATPRAAVGHHLVLAPPTRCRCSWNSSQLLCPPL